MESPQRPHSGTIGKEDTMDREYLQLCESEPERDFSLENTHPYLESVAGHEQVLRMRLAI